MGTHFLCEVATPDLTNHPAPPDEGFVSFYGRDGRPYARNSAGQIFDLAEGGSGGGQQEVFIGAPPEPINHPALVFLPVEIDGQTTYRMQVNVP